THRGGRRADRPPSAAQPKCVAAARHRGSSPAEHRRWGVRADCVPPRPPSSARVGRPDLVPAVVTGPCAVPADHLALPRRPRPCTPLAVAVWAYSLLCAGYLALLIGVVVDAIDGHRLQVDSYGGLTAIDYPAGWFALAQDAILGM